MKRLGIVGLGQMGRPMATNLLKAGYSLTVYSRTMASAEELVARGATAASSPGNVGANSDAVLLSLPTSEDVREVIFGQSGISSGLSRGGIIIDTSTIEPDSSRKFSQELGSKDLHFLDAPVSGGPEGAERATLTFMVGGERDIFEECYDVFSVLGKNIFYMGDSGSGEATKLVNQLLVAANTLASAEAVRLARALGLDPSAVSRVIELSAGDSFAFRRTAPMMISRKFGEGWQSYLLEKDLKLVLRTASRQGLRLFTSELALGVFSESLKLGLAKTDSASVIEVLEKMPPLDGG